MIIQLEPMRPDQIAYFQRLLDMSTANLNALCSECGAPFNDHMIGGNGPYHPQPVKAQSSRRD